MKQWRDDIKRFFATYFMINYETGMLEWIDGGEVKTRDDAYGNPMIRYGTRDYYLKYVIWFLHHEVQATKRIIFKDGNKRNCHPNNLLQEI
ncbi:TPA: HNH endonuclease [Escherichia coli]|uniref:HNH endonuclease n=1 Tax=Escherichia coli TaxID=562 RepID=UPI00069A859E|nr:HNH endonuclease [Escherichia coli]EHW5312331.1 HNH endonuclease [Escherichia albertii]EEV9040161.1 HNH endonuclease [Escherichia coli]EKK4981626.1 HNH endonuclease [Escherichia coli]KNZ99655.1 hypothetical protein AKG99_07540 [Escherichia coli]MCZ8962918.1 HNH endonuclease [Escherichia albertii]